MGGDPDPPLGELFGESPDLRLDGGDAADRVAILGGRYDQRRLREKARVVHAPRSDDYAFVAIIADEVHADPVCFYADDYGADLHGAHPVRARTFFEWQLMLGGRCPEDVAVFKRVGYPGNHPIIEIDADAFPDGIAFVGDPNPKRAQYGVGTWAHLAGKLGLPGHAKSKAPKERTYLEVFASKPRSTVAQVLPLLRALEIFQQVKDLGDTALLKAKKPGVKGAAALLGTLTLSPDRPSKAPKAELEHSSEMSDEAVARVAETLTSFGMQRLPWSD